MISLRTCFQAVGVEQDDWFPLGDADGRACGEVRLELAYFVDADDDFTDSRPMALVIKQQLLQQTPSTRAPTAASSSAAAA